MSKNKSPPSCSSDPGKLSVWDTAPHRESIYDPVWAKGQSEIIISDLQLPFWAFPLWAHTDASTSPPLDASSSPGCHKCRGSPAAARWSWEEIQKETFCRHWDTCELLWRAEDFSEAKQPSAVWGRKTCLDKLLETKTQLNSNVYILEFG